MLLGLRILNRQQSDDNMGTYVQDAFACVFSQVVRARLWIC